MYFACWRLLFMASLPLHDVLHACYSIPPALQATWYVRNNTLTPPHSSLCRQPGGVPVRAQPPAHQRPKV